MFSVWSLSQIYWQVIGTILEEHLIFEMLSIKMRRQRLYWVNESIFLIQVSYSNDVGLFWATETPKNRIFSY